MKKCEYKYLVYYYWWEDMEHTFEAIVDTEERAKELHKSDKKWVKIFAIIAIISALCTVFVPNQKELFAIYGIGGTIDYVKSNDTAKQLPDKCINALDKWVDSYVKEENK